MTSRVIKTAYRHIVPYTLTLRILSLTTAPSLAAILQVEHASAAVPVVAERFSVGDLLSDTNAARIAAGLAPLAINPELSRAAAAKAIDMRDKGYWDHYRPADNKAPWDFISEAGYSYTFAGENLARGFATPEGIVNAWLASPSHRANLLSKHYTEVGFADVIVTEADGTETTYTVQMFGSR